MPVLVPFKPLCQQPDSFVEDYLFNKVELFDQVGVIFCCIHLIGYRSFLSFENKRGSLKKAASSTFKIYASEENLNWFLNTMD